MTIKQATTHRHLLDWYHICARIHEQLEHELTMRQWLILTHIYLVEGDHNVTSLNYALNIPKPAICRALDALSCDGLVRRRKQNDDKRIIYAEKTMKGIAFLNHFSDILERYNNDAQHPQRING